MTTKGVKRKLTAILSADVEGYSRLMSQDEVGTIRTLTAYREAMASPIQQYKGRVIDTPVSGRDSQRVHICHWTGDKQGEAWP